MSSKYTFGAELELADWDRRVQLSRHLGVKDVNDTTVMNSNGTCVNPYKEGGRGGEICTRVCNSPLDLATVCQEIFYVLGLQTINVNHSTWLHIHVGLPEDTYDSLSKLKNILKYVYKNSLQIRDYTSICPVKEGGRMKPEDRIRRNLTRTSVMTETEYNGALAAKSLDEFWKFFERKRHMVNMLPLKYQGTIEFRCFYMTTSFTRIQQTAEFVEDFVTDMFSENPIDVVGLLYEKTYLFPAAIQFDPVLEEVYKATLVDKQPKLDNFTLKAWGSGN